MNDVNVKEVHKLVVGIAFMIPNEKCKNYPEILGHHVEKY